jgi:hypothetical protein
VEKRRFARVYLSGFELVLVVRIWTKRGSLKHSDWKNSDWKHRGSEGTEVGGGGSKYPGTGAPILDLGWLVRVCRWE